MDPGRIKELLDAVGAGTLSTDEAMRELRDLPFRALGFANADTHRHLRTGYPEVVLGQGKSAEQIAAIMAELGRGGSTVLATRVEAAVADDVVRRLPEARYLSVPRALVLGPVPQPDAAAGAVAVLSAGTADVPVAEEAALSVEIGACRVERIYDVGVAGLHRLVAHRARIEAATVLIVVAGMEGALPSVVAGLFAKPVIAVPTSVGYGASLGGVAALLSMLNSCASGVAVVNIDNGFGAGRMATMLCRGRPA